MLFQHPQQLLSSRAHANSNTRLVNPDPSTENYNAPSQHIILPARPENVAASNTHHQQQQTVTATAAREQQQHPTTANAGDKYGSKIPSVNRMGGLDPVEIENLFDNHKIAFVAPVAESEILVETTEANPTSTIQPFDEEEFTSNLKFQLNVVEQQQLAVVPVTTNAPEEFDDSKINDDKLVAPQTDKDSYNNLTTEKSAESSTVDGGVESVQNVLTANESQPLSEELTTTVQPNLASADAQTSAVVVTLNSVSEKDLDADDYRATTLASPTTDPAAHFLELPDVSPTEESTEFSSSTNKAIAVSSSSSDLVDDSTQSNFVTGLETTTFIPDISSVQSTGSDNNGLQDELTELKATSPIADVFSSPIVESLDFNVIADSNSFSSGIIISDGNATANIQVSSFAESSSAPGNGSQLLTPTASSAVTPTTASSYTETTPSASTTTQPIIKTTDSVISLIAYKDGKRTLYGNDERHCIF
jgi:hypothetical protein